MAPTLYRVDMKRNNPVYVLDNARAKADKATLDAVAARACSVHGREARASGVTVCEAPVLVKATKKTAGDMGVLDMHMVYFQGHATPVPVISKDNSPLQDLADAAAKGFRNVKIASIKEEGRVWLIRAA